MSLTLVQSQLELINNIAEKAGMKNYHLETSAGAQKGDGYAGQIVLVSVVSPEKNLKILLKIASKSIKVRKRTLVRKAFELETFMYKEVFGHYENLQKDSKIIYTPTKLHGCVLDEFEECLALENLKEDGFKLWDRNLPMDYNHINLIFETYGKYHALSFVTQHLYPDKYKQWRENVKKIEENSSIVNFDEQFQMLFSQIIKLFDNKHSVAKIENLAKNWGKVYLQEFDEKYTVLIHGDCWCNNFLFRYDDSTDRSKPTNIRLIDFQLSTFTTPVRDLSYCLFADTDKQCFSKYRDYLATYHNSMGEVLKNYNLDINTVYPYEILQEQWKDTAKSGLLTALIALKIALVPAEDALDVNEIAENDGSFMECLVKSLPGNEKYNNRVKDLMDFFIENDWI